jgi:hypothetical protein
MPDATLTPERRLDPNRGSRFCRAAGPEICCAGMRLRSMSMSSAYQHQPEHVSYMCAVVCCRVVHGGECVRVVGAATRGESEARECCTHTHAARRRHYTIHTHMHMHMCCCVCVRERPACKQRFAHAKAHIHTRTTRRSTRPRQDGRACLTYTLYFYIYTYTYTTSSSFSLCFSYYFVIVKTF